MRRGRHMSVDTSKVPSMTDHLDNFPLPALLCIAEENIRQAAERLEQRGVLAEDSQTAAQLAAVRIWLASVARRLST
jgi:hypothetical protein